MEQRLIRQHHHLRKREKDCMHRVVFERECVASGVCVPELLVWPSSCCSKDTRVSPGRAAGAAPHLAPSPAPRPSSPSNFQNPRRDTSPWQHRVAVSSQSLMPFLVSLQMEVRTTTFSSCHSRLIMLSLGDLKSAGFERF